MSKLRTVFLFAAVFAAVFISGCTVPAHYTEVAPAANYYPLAVGNHWTYEFVPGGKRYDADITETKVLNGETTFAYAINDSYSYMAVRPDGVYQCAQGEPQSPTNAVVFDPPQLQYKLPFEIGDSWNTPVLLQPTEAKSDRVQVYGRVESFEDVKVPAGMFKQCVRVLIDDPRDSPAEVTELWFAPNVGIVKTLTQLTRSDGLPGKSYATELVSYKLKASR